jgi:hypothetical protein
MVCMTLRWRRQSCANSSLNPRNSLLEGKNREFSPFGLARPPGGAKYGSRFNSLRGNSLRIGTGAERPPPTEIETTPACSQVQPGRAKRDRPRNDKFESLAVALIYCNCIIFPVVACFGASASGRYGGVTYWTRDRSPIITNGTSAAGFLNGNTSVSQGTGSNFAFRNALNTRRSKFLALPSVFDKQTKMPDHHLYHKGGIYSPHLMPALAKTRSIRKANIDGSDPGLAITLIAPAFPRNDINELYWSLSSVRGAASYSNAMIFDCCALLTRSSTTKRETVHTDSIATPTITSQVAMRWVASEYFGRSRNIPAPTAIPASTLSDNSARWGKNGSAVPDHTALKHLSIAAILAWLFAAFAAVFALGRSLRIIPCTALELDHTIIPP